MYLSQAKLKWQKRQEDSFRCDYFVMDAAKAVVGSGKIAWCL